MGGGKGSGTLKDITIEKMKLEKRKPVQEVLVMDITLKVLSISLKNRELPLIFSVYWYNDLHLTKLENSLCY